MLADKVAEKMLFKVDRRKQYDHHTWLYLGWRVASNKAEQVVLQVQIADGQARYRLYNYHPARFWLAAPYLRRP